MLIICHFNIYFAEEDDMHEAGYVDSIWSLWYHFTFG